MKKGINFFLIFLTFAFFSSCTSSNVENDKTFINAIEINKNKIDELYINNKFDLSNNEINTYYVNIMKLKNTPELTIDFKPSIGKIDNLFVNNIVGENTLLLNVNILGEKTTIAKDIPFLVSKDKVDIQLKNEINMDNTLFEIVIKQRDGYIFYFLKPYFLNEIDFAIKVNKLDEYIDEQSEYKENIIVNLEKIQLKDDDKYIINSSTIAEGQIIKGKALPNSILEITYLDNKMYTKVDENGNYKTIVPITKGEIKIKQLEEFKK